MSIMRPKHFALQSYSSYTPGPIIDSKLGRKHQGDLQGKR